MQGFIFDELKQLIECTNMNEQDWCNKLRTRARKPAKSFVTDAAAKRAPKALRQYHLFRKESVIQVNDLGNEQLLPRNPEL